MKIKLLKKVRKRFKILHYINTHSVDLMDSDYIFPYIAKKSEAVNHTSNFEHNAKSLKEATNKLKDYIVLILKEEYKFLGRKRQAENAHKNKSIQIWP